MPKAFSELIDYIESHRGTKTCVLPMGELYGFYVYRLASLGVTEYNIHRTRFRRQILASIPDLVEVKGPSGYYNLVFDEDIIKL